MGIVTVQIAHCTRYSPALSLPPTCIEKKSCLEDLIKPGLVGMGGGLSLAHPAAPDFHSSVYPEYLPPLGRGTSRGAGCQLQPIDSPRILCLQRDMHVT